MSSLPPLPTTMLKWNFYGDGFDSLKVEEAEVPTNGPDELLVRQDACGLCFSDTKVIGLGPNHPRMAGRDLQSDPVTLGHEVSCTVVRVGENLAGKFQVGQRFIVQADVFYQGISMAYGYSISGGLAEYSVIPTSMINGDEGCYLLPLNPLDGYVETALVEPWACVVSAYNQEHRAGIKRCGRTLIFGAASADKLLYDGIFEDGKPSTVVYVDCGMPIPRRLQNECTGADLQIISDRGLDFEALKTSATNGEGFNDILFMGCVDAGHISHVAGLLANHGIVNFVGLIFDGKVSVDIGRIHYNWHYYLGTNSGDARDSYRETRSAYLKEGGNSWFIGAGGPMGQMHVQQAVQNPYPPRLIMATDIDSERLQSVVDRFGKEAAERGIKLITLNPSLLTPESFDARLRELSNGAGFDDIVSLVPVASLIEHAADFLATGAWFNIFAGVARGTMAKLDLNLVTQRRVRFIGSSGSSIEDMRETLSRVESGELSTNSSLAAIGGMRAAKEGIQAVKEGRFPGKTLVFPLIPDLPLTPLADLSTSYPTVFAKLKDGQFWTKEAEDEFLRIAL